jgi:Fic family protein
MARPPFQITGKAATLCGRILSRFGRYEGLARPRVEPHLRRRIRVRTVQGTLAIEGNRLSIDQVTALLDGKHVIGPAAEVREATNALAAYRDASDLHPGRQSDLLLAHRRLMSGLLPDAGKYRTGDVGVLRGDQVVHVAPPARRVAGLVAGLLRWYRRAHDVPVPIRSSVLHYELTFIHPFSDGNGRLARLWQHVALVRAASLFQWAPIESLVRQRQRRYYQTLRACDRAGDSSAFIELMLAAIDDALEELFGQLRVEPLRAEDRLATMRKVVGRSWFARRDYLREQKSLSPATASRDLASGVGAGILQRKGDKALARYRFR